MIKRGSILIAMAAAACFLITSCSLSGKKARVIVYPKMGMDEKLYLSKVPFDGKTILLDSVIVKNNQDPLTFSYLNDQEAVYTITSSFNNYTVSFISDSSEITLHADFFARIAVINSKATNSLLRFRKEQLPHVRQKDSTFQRQAVNYEDTVKSPAAFVLVYNDIDFGKDYKGLKKFILHNRKRFADYPAFQDIAQRANGFIKIMTEEYQVGDQLPVLTLPDRNGKLYRTAQLKGKLYFIDFWSTFSPACTAYIPFKKEAKNHFSSDKFEMVSVALDPDAGDWKRYIDHEKLNWPQLIDQQVWEGEAVKTIKFDSVPENFLVSAKGKILARSIPADSLIYMIGRFLQR